MMPIEPQPATPSASVFVLLYPYIHSKASKHRTHLEVR
jgi:hypothetical protein